MENQIIGVKFLHTQDYQDLLNTTNLLALTAGKTYAYISAGFEVQVGDLVIVPNSGYNDTALVPALVTVLNNQVGLEYATKPILAVIQKDTLKQREQYSLDVYQQLRNRQNTLEQLDRVYEQANKLKKMQKMAKSNPEIAALLKDLQKQDQALKDLKSTDYHATTTDSDDTDELDPVNEDDYYFYKYK